MSTISEAAERLRKGGTGHWASNHVIGEYWEEEHDSEDMATVVNEYLRLTDPTAIDEDWLKSLGWRDWELDDDEFEGALWVPANSELGWKCRLVWLANGVYVARMHPNDDDDSDYRGPSESVELFDSRNRTKVVTRGQLRMLCMSLGIDLKETE